MIATSLRIMVVILRRFDSTFELRGYVNRGVIEIEANQLWDDRSDSFSHRRWQI